MPTTEVDAIETIDKALSALKDKEARQRVLVWALAKYAIDGEVNPLSARKRLSGTPVTLHTVPRTRNEIAGIAKIQENGTFKLTVRDPKAKSTKDAAIRLAHIVIHAYTELTGESSVSSKKVLVPTLREWRAYDGNTRLALARHKGIIRDGDSLSLDAHSKKDAIRFIDEALEESIEGTWRLRSKAHKRVSKNLR
jgi:hypothetical protein